MTATFTLTVDTDNAAFDEASELELVRIIVLAAKEVAEGNRAGNVRDLNGNTVGSFALDLAEKATDQPIREGR